MQLVGNMLMRRVSKPGGTWCRVGRGGRLIGHFLDNALIKTCRSPPPKISIACVGGRWVSWAFPPASHRQQHQWACWRPRVGGGHPHHHPGRSVVGLQRPPALPAGTASGRPATLPGGGETNQPKKKVKNKSCI